MASAIISPQTRGDKRPHGPRTLAPSCLTESPPLPMAARDGRTRPGEPYPLSHWQNGRFHGIFWEKYGTSRIFWYEKSAQWLDNRNMTGKPSFFTT